MPQDARSRSAAVEAVAEDESRRLEGAETVWSGQGRSAQLAGRERAFVLRNEVGWRPGCATQ